MVLAETMEERPRDKLERYGPARLSDEELMQVMLGAGSRRCSARSLASRVTEYVRENVNLLNQNHVDFLERLRGMGMGNAGAARVAATIELSSRIRERGERAIREAGDVIPYLSSIAQKPQEYFVCITMNGGNRIISRRVITIGLADQALVHPREVFAEAIRERASKIIVAHNHPGGDMTPSREDIRITENLQKAASILGLDLLDHVIVAKGGYFSFREEGMLQTPALNGSSQ